jgi:hypothetical protein
MGLSTIVQSSRVPSRPRRRRCAPIRYPEALSAVVARGDDRPSAAEGACQRPAEAGAGVERMEARSARETLELPGSVPERDCVVLHERVAVRTAPPWLCPVPDGLGQKRPVNGPEIVLPSDCRVSVRVPSTSKQRPFGSKVGPKAYASRRFPARPAAWCRTRRLRRKDTGLRSPSSRSGRERPVESDRGARASRSHREDPYGKDDDEKSTERRQTPSRFARTSIRPYSTSLGGACRRSHSVQGDRPMMS